MKPYKCDKCNKQSSIIYSNKSEGKTVGYCEKCNGEEIDKEELTNKQFIVECVDKLLAQIFQYYIITIVVYYFNKKKHMKHISEYLTKIQEINDRYKVDNDFELRATRDSINPLLKTKMYHGGNSVELPQDYKNKANEY